MVGAAVLSGMVGVGSCVLASGVGSSGGFVSWICCEVAGVHGFGLVCCGGNTAMDDEPESLILAQSERWRNA